MILDNVLVIVVFVISIVIVIELNILQFFTPILDEVLEDIEGGRFSVQVNFIR